jgi:hypothetical protein
LEEGVDYTSVFVPTIQTSTIMLALLIMAMHQWMALRFDVKSAYLYATLKETIYMQIPHGMT